MCSGVRGGELVIDEGARVGDEVLDCKGMAAGSKSRSGMGGARIGRRVIFTSVSRRKALR